MEWSFHWYSFFFFNFSEYLKCRIRMMFNNFYNKVIKKEFNLRILNIIIYIIYVIGYIVYIIYILNNNNIMYIYLINDKRKVNK